MVQFTYKLNTSVWEKSARCGQPPDKHPAHQSVWVNVFFFFFCIASFMSCLHPSKTMANNVYWLSLFQFCTSMASVNTKTTVADPFFVWRLNWALLCGVNAFEHDQKESNAVTDLEEAKCLGFVHLRTNSEKTQCHQRHNDSVWHHVYHKLNSHSLC